MTENFRSAELQKAACSLNNYRWQFGPRGCRTVWTGNWQGDQRREGDRPGYILTGFRLKMINYLPGFFGSSKFLWFLLRCVPQGPGLKVMLSKLLLFFPIVAQDLSLFTFSPLLQHGRRARFGLIRHSSQVLMCLLFHPLSSITQSLTFK